MSEDVALNIDSYVAYRHGDTVKACPIYLIYLETISFIVFHLEIGSHTPNFEVFVYPLFPVSFHLRGAIYYSLGSIEELALSRCQS